jgi:hypothetical protein
MLAPLAQHESHAACRGVNKDRLTGARPPHIEEGLSRRGLVQALAAGAAASVATPASAEQAATLAEATSADYGRDPTRWGSAEVAALFPGFKHIDMRTKGGARHCSTFARGLG